MDKKLQKLQKVVEKESLIKKGILSLANEIVKVEESIDEVKNVVTEIQQNIEIVKKEKGEKGNDGEDGKDYILTEDDKKEIASLIEVPIVEKVVERVEKTEVIREIPVSEPVDTDKIALEASKIALEEVKAIIPKDLTSVEIRSFLEDLKDDERLDASAIKNLPEFIGRTTQGMSSGVRYLKWLNDVNAHNPSNGQALVFNSTIKKWEPQEIDFSGYVPYSGLSASNVIANTLTYFNASKQASSVTLDGSLVLSAGVLGVDTNYSFTWNADHLWRSTNVRIEGTDTDLTNGLILYNNESNARPFFKLADRAQEFYVGFKAPDDFNANNPMILWSLPDIDSLGVWKSDGAGTLSISQVNLTSDITGVLGYANGGTNSSTSFTAGSVIFAGASGFEQDNTNFRWDNSNKRLGIGVTPSYGLHVSKSDTIPAYFNGSGASTRLAINNGSNTGIGLYVATALKWSITSVNGGGGGTNPDLVFYNDQTSTNTLWLDGNNNNVSIGVVAPSTTNKFHVESTYATSASRIAYFKGTSGTSGLQIDTNGQAQYMARSSTHTDRELRFQAYSDGNIYISAQGLSGTITANLNFLISADSGVNNGFIGFRNVTLGNEVTRIFSDSTNDDPRESVFQNRVTTTNNTVTTLHTFTLSASTAYAIEANVTARRTGGSAGTAEDCAEYKIRGLFKLVSGTATQVGTTTVISSHEDNANLDATFDVTGATARVRVTGDTNNNYTWHMTARTYQLSS